MASEVTLKETRATRALDLKIDRNASGIPESERAHLLVTLHWDTSKLLPRNQPRPQTMATEVVRLPPMLKVRNLCAFSI
jgi:hypothetical protein